MRLVRSRPRLLARLFRVMVLVVLAAFVGQGTLAWLSPCSAHAAEATGEEDTCCPHRAAEAASSTDEAALTGGVIRQDRSDDARCACPVACGKCCSGVPSSSVSTVPAAAPTAVLTFSLLTFVTPPRVASDGERFDILHVPRA